jgi:peptidoglycan/LPS O-acetylase OafA/YrhL
MSVVFESFMQSSGILTTGKQEARMQRVKELDSIRGLASLVIVVYHLWLIKVGVLGAAVDLFFVLSGFLITSILLNNPMSGRFLISFYARRSLRIWPIYYLSLLFLVFINPHTAEPGSLDGLPYFATFTQNVTFYWSGSAPAFIPAFRHTWSLAIEEQFYVFWPALLWLTGRRGIPLVTAGLIGLAVCTRILQFNSWILATHCDGLALGALLSYLIATPSLGIPGRKPRFLALGLGAASFWMGSALAVRLASPAWQASLLIPLQSLRMFSLNLAFFALVGLTVRHAGHPWLGILRRRELVYLGQISYGLYLYHHIVFMLWDDYSARMGIQNHLGFDVAKAALSFAIAAFSWRFVERPILSVKDRFRYREGAAARKAGHGRWHGKEKSLPHTAVLESAAANGSRSGANGRELWNRQ